MKFSKSDILSGTITFQPENLEEVFVLGRLYQSLKGSTWGYSVEMKLGVTVPLSDLISKSIEDTNKNEEDQG
jgi:hypothetical protein